MQYAKTDLPSFLSVRSITTIFQVDFSTYPRSGGESHNFCELKYIERGNHQVLLDGTPFDLSEGDMIIYAPGVYHDSKEPSSALADIISFESDGIAFPQLYNKIITLNVHQRQMISQIIKNGETIFRATYPDEEIVGMIPRDNTNELELQMLKNQLELFFLDIYQTESKRDANFKLYKNEQFDSLIKYLKSNLCRNLTLEDIARECSMSISKLKLICKEQCGCAPISLFISLKIDEAKRMISETPLNFTQISDRLGFASVHYFSKLFKKKTGLTPSEYARSLQNKK